MSQGQPPATPRDGKFCFSGSADAGKSSLAQIYSLPLHASHLSQKHPTSTKFVLALMRFQFPALHELRALFQRYL